MKKLICFSIMCMFLLTSVSAFDFDNSLRYEEQDMKVTFENIWGLPFFGSDLGTAELKSHDSVNQVREVAAGNSITMWYDFDFKDIQKNGLGNVYFTDKKTGEIIERDFKYVYWVTEERERNIYGKGNCITNSNGTSCEQIIVDVEKYEWEGWLPYNSKDIPKGKITIGIKTFVEMNDYVDGVWEIVGQKVERHAEWLQSFNVGLMHVWSFEETSAIKLRDEVSGITNMSEVGSPSNVTGIIGDAYFFGDGDHLVNATPFLDLPVGASDRTVCMWIFATDITTNPFFFGYGGGGNNQRFSFLVLAASSKVRLLLGGTVDAEIDSVDVMNVNSQQFICGVEDSGTQRLYINATAQGTAGNTLDTQVTSVYIGAHDVNPTEDWRGRIDEVMFWNRTLGQPEIENIYLAMLDGNGFTDVFQALDVTLNTPANDTNSSSPSVTFNCSSTDDVVVLNLTLIIDDVDNQTITGTDNNLSIQTTENIADGIHNWTCRASDGTGVLDPVTATARTFTIDSVPPSIDIIIPSGVIDIFTIGNLLELNVSFSDSNLETCLHEYNGINTTFVCATNTTFTPVIGVKEITVYANDTFGNLARNNTAWNYTLKLNSNTSRNNFTYETAEETFSVNVTANGSSEVSANFFWNGTSFGAATKSGDNSEMVFSKTIQIPTITAKGLHPFFWSFNFGSQNINSSSTDQDVSVSNLTLCSVFPQNFSFINFTFQNETISQEKTTAIIGSTFTYWLGDGTVNKTLTFSNASENPEYVFCFSPENRTVNVDYEILYNNAESQQRISIATSILSSVTTNVVLSLLPTSLGLFTQFRTEDSIGNTLATVKAVITTIIGGGTITSGIDFTDSSGIVVFFLNPDRTYTGTFTKSGFVNNIFSFVPITDTRTVIMGSGVVAPGGSNITENITTYEIKPFNSSLSNSTTFTFSFEVAGNSEITLISMNITNSSGFQVAFESNAGTGIVSTNLNTGTNQSFIGTFIIKTGEETLTISKLWIIGDVFEGDYSLHKQLRLFTEYGFGDFWKYLIVILSIAGVLIFMSSGEVIDTSESKVMVVVLMIWGWSLVGWLDNPAVVSTTGLAQFSRQYGIAILTTLAGFIFIFRKIFRLVTT